jgi:hypothetical protein
VTAHADGAPGPTATFDYGDATAADTQPVTAGAADSAHTYAANGTFTITASSGEATPGTTSVTIADITTAEFDPGEYTIADVEAYVTANPDQTQAVRVAEAAGKGRSTLLGWLDGVIAG